MTLTEAKHYLKRGDLAKIAKAYKVHRNACYSAIRKGTGKSVVKPAIIALAQRRKAQASTLSKSL